MRKRLQSLDLMMGNLESFSSEVIDYIGLTSGQLRIISLKPVEHIHIKFQYLRQTVGPSPANRAKSGRGGEV